VPRDQAVVLAELDAELARIPQLGTPDLATVIRLGLEAGRPDTIRAETAQKMSTTNIVAALQDIMMFPGILTGEKFIQFSLGECHYEVGKWADLVQALLSWKENHHLIWPKEELTTPTA